MKLLGYFLLVVLCSGCAVRNSIVFPERMALDDSLSQAFLAEVNERVGHVTDIRGISEASIRSGDEVSKVRYAVVFSPPKIRIELFPTTSFYSLALLVSNGRGVTMLDYQNNTAFQGEDLSEAIQRFLGLPLTEEHLRAVLFGSLPTVKTKVARCDGELYCVLQREARLFAEVSQNRAVQKVLALSSSGEVEVVAERRIDPQGLLESLKFEIPHRDITVTLSFRGVRVNAQPKDSIFEVVIPPSFSVRD